MNRLFLVVGPSGSGKSTLARALSYQGVPEIVSLTSRQPRVGELDGVDYHFMSPEDFKEAAEAGSLLEHVSYSGHSYGTSRMSVANALARGPACLVVEATGAKQIKAEIGDLARVMVLSPPPIEELRRRMLARGDAPDTVQKRLDRVASDVNAVMGPGIIDCVLPPLCPESLLALALRFIDEKPAIRHVYVAGPYTGDPTGNTARAIDAAEPLLCMGMYPYIPHLSHFWEQQHPHHYEDWMRLDLGWLAKCDALLRLPGHSHGADREVAFAKEHRIPVFYDSEALLVGARVRPCP